jgi:hypothetical protein
LAASGFKAVTSWALESFVCKTVGTVTDATIAIKKRMKKFFIGW